MSAGRTAGECGLLLCTHLSLLELFGYVQHSWEAGEGGNYHTALQESFGSRGHSHPHNDFYFELLMLHMLCRAWLDLAADEAVTGDNVQQQESVSADVLAAAVEKLAGGYSVAAEPSTAVQGMQVSKFAVCASRHQNTCRAPRLSICNC